jgi:hypothetical protein
MTTTPKATHASHPSYPWKTLCGRPISSLSKFRDDDTACLTCRRLWRRLTPNQQKRA